MFPHRLTAFSFMTTGARLSYADNSSVKLESPVPSIKSCWMLADGAGVIIQGLRVNTGPEAASVVDFKPVAATLPYAATGYLVGLFLR
jgi:hypothetical protein